MLPFDDRDGQIWFDGELIPWRDAKVHVLTHGLHYASCVFEGERVYNGSVFKLTEHSERLVRSAEILGFKLPYSVAEIDAETNLVVKSQGFTDAYVRPVAWRGSEMMGVAAQQNKIHVAIACWQWPSYFTPEARMAGIKLEISQWARPAPNTAPTASKAAGLYMICTMSKHAAENNGFHDALMSGLELPVTTADSRRALEIVTAFYHSSSTNEDVLLPIGPGHPLYESWVPAQFRAAAEQEAAAFPLILDRDVTVGWGTIRG